MVNNEGILRDVVVIGASAGGVKALQTIFAELPPDFPGSVITVLHRSPHFESRLGEVLGFGSRIEVVEPEQGDRLAQGQVWIAPADVHLTLEEGHARLSRGPKLHHTRPAIDPLFESASRAYGPRVVGLLLTGGGDDGVDGMIAIKNKSGISIAQDPGEAASPSMPWNAILRDHVDLILPVASVAEVLVALANGDVLLAGATAS